MGRKDLDLVLEKDRRIMNEAVRSQSVALANGLTDDPMDSQALGAKPNLHLPGGIPMAD